MWRIAAVQCRAALFCGLVLAPLGACGDTSPLVDLSVTDGPIDSRTNVDQLNASIDAGSHDASVDPPTAYTGTLQGKVVDPEGNALEGALVRIGGRLEMTHSAADGTFTLTIVDPPVDLSQFALTAGMEEHFSNGIEVRQPERLQEIVLRPVTLVDNPDYTYKGADDIKPVPYCIHCHKTQRNAWRPSAHARSASNERLHDIYNGAASGFTDQATCEANGGAWLEGRAKGSAATAKKCYQLGGVNVLAELNTGSCGEAGKPACDHPTLSEPVVTGPCADCHAPAHVGGQPGAVNLNHVSGIALGSGVHCDYCHKIRKVEANQKPGMAGAITMLRPADPPPGAAWSDPEVYFGPLSDVFTPIMGNIYNPQFTKSEFCSACHQWSEAGFSSSDKAIVDLTKWPAGLPLQDTYDEWSASNWAAIGVQCQNCHMPAIPSITAASDIIGIPYWTSGENGWPRTLGEVHDHGVLPRPPAADGDYQQGPGDPSRTVLRQPLTVDIQSTRSTDGLALTISLENKNAGHSLPTGTPSRQWLLLVQASAAGEPLLASQGYTLPAWSGYYRKGNVGPADLLLGANQAILKTGSWGSEDVGRVIRFVVPTGVFDDYPGWGWFGAPGRSAKEKGLEIHQPVGEAVIQSIDGQTATLDRIVSVADDALYYVGDALPIGLAVDQSSASAALAGASGNSFAKVMVDKTGNKAVHFFRAVDIAADNRIPAGKTATTVHNFDLGIHTNSVVEVTVSLLYRRAHWQLARERGWISLDVVRYVETVIIAP